jgi:hypothetical protein
MGILDVISGIANTAGNAISKYAPGVINTLTPYAQQFAPIASQLISGLAPTAMSWLGQKIGGQQGGQWGNYAGNMTAQYMGYPQQQQPPQMPQLPPWAQQAQQYAQTIAPQGFNTPWSQMAGNAAQMAANTAANYLPPQFQSLANYIPQAPQWMTGPQPPISPAPMPAGPQPMYGPPQYAQGGYSEGGSVGNGMNHLFGEKSHPRLQFHPQYV